MVVTCDIEFDENPCATYFAGQLLSGKVTLKTDKTTEVKGVKLKVYGFAGTKWTEKVYYRNKWFEGFEEYMATRIFLLGSADPSIEDKCTIAAGTHQFEFACQLPFKCPTSFEGTAGYVRFFVKVVLLNQWTFNQAFTRGFTVLRPADLNFDSPQLKLPASTSNYRTYGCSQCTRGTLKLQLSIPQSAFVPGQTIPATLLVINDTKKHVMHVDFGLVMLVRYYSNSDPPNTRVEELPVSYAAALGVPPKSTRSITANLYVRSTPPTCLNTCKIIQIAYQVEAVAKMDVFYKKHLISIPVTIGNVPLWKSAALEQEQQINNNGSARASQITSPFIRSIPNALYPDLPPPTFEECKHTVLANINEDQYNAFERNEFAPLYPVYKLDDMKEEETENAGYVNESYIG